uniref:Uncharacterized protein n=1 Tax=Oryza meridionalis TaxID=40149 RepID=A0A0E0DZI0_9ORYZ
MVTVAGYMYRVTVAGYMYTVRFGGLIRSETFVPPSSPSGQELLSNPNPSRLPTRSRRRRRHRRPRHRRRLPLEHVKPEPPPSSQARGASRRRHRAEPVVTVAVFPSTSCESDVPLSPPFPSPSPSHADFDSCKICARIERPQARGNQKVKLDVGLQIFLEAQTKRSRMVHQTSKKYMGSDGTFLREGIYEFNGKILSISPYSSSCLAFLTYLHCFPIFSYIRTICMSPHQSYNHIFLYSKSICC